MAQNGDLALSICFLIQFLNINILLFFPKKMGVVLDMKLALHTARNEIEM